MEDYDISWPRTYGGNTGDYIIASPFNGPCEMLIMSAYMQTNGSAYISRSATNAGATSSIASTNIAGTQGSEGIYINANPDGSMALCPVWIPMQGQCSLQVIGTALVTIVFRRKHNSQLAEQVSAQGNDAPGAHVTSTSGGKLPTNPYADDNYRGGF